jgi:hypothetical protein
MAAAAPTCYRCERGLDRETWLAGDACRHCGSALEFLKFPALHATRAQARAQAALPEDAACFFHADNRAESVCEGCGRYLCAVCGVDFGGARLCPQCISARRAAKKDCGRGLVLHDSIALTLAVLPVLLVFVTCLTAPLALGYTLYAWRKPLGVTRRSRWRLWAALVISALTCLAWVGVALMAYFA